ncbi:pleckstrin homology domain-containing family F member 1-like [Poeciliopsis prolifica]|uniref:pleckstrin homology domain-containing family F member 1-like n=1 Tax=Poeciliopsis prolifica TaxID=188132 RepID=UPI0024132752|nr:pleckstrin homology domain-containing family F member 1-like [Poeciliopsis prolifica]
MDLLVSEYQNRQRIKKIENSFRPSAPQLFTPGRFLTGEGPLMKQGRKKREEKMFFLFNDILVYSSIIMTNRWYKNPKIIPLKDIKLDDLEDSDDVQHQWLICTPRKSFYVSASSGEEKKAWMQHIEVCQQTLLQEPGPQTETTYARSWIPDRAAQKCMRCFATFTGINRRHHCRKCGFVVCNTCSKGRALIQRIHPNKPLRICKVCNKTDDDKTSRLRGGSSGWWDETCSDEE